MREEFVEPDPVLRKKMKLKGEKGKVEKVKETASEKKEDVKEKMGEKKEEMDSKMHEIKEGASEKKEEIKEDLGEAKEEAKKKKAKLEKESEEEGRTPGEKLLNDIVKKFRKGSRADQRNNIRLYRRIYRIQKTCRKTIGGYIRN